MNDSAHRPPSLDYILKKTSDDKAIALFNCIAISDGDTDIALRELNLTTKQYYSRIAGLMDSGLIERHKGKYTLTLLGKVVYDAHMTIGKALTYYWKLKALESIEMSSGATLPEGESTQLISALIDDHQIRDILMKAIPVRPTKEDPKMPKMATIVERI
jgi:hypothetical protein